MQGVDVETEVIGWVPSLTNDAAAMALVREEAEASGMFVEVRGTHQAGASEDAGFLMERVQLRGGDATFMVVGTTLAAPHHHFAFDIDEESLPSAVDLLERVGRRAAGT
jgi:aminobenzoyl-glutamate utilization protein A